MSRFFARRAEDLEWEVTVPGASGSPSPFGVRRKILGDETQGPFVRLAEYAPGHEEPAHHHDADGVYYILRGEVQLGADRYGAGSLLFVERDTVYGPLKAGPEGFQFLLIRPMPARYVPVSETGA
jgi:quercetin dioxygenase-like cupin family protein